MRKEVRPAISIVIVLLACSGVTAQTPTCKQLGSNDGTVVVKETDDTYPPCSITQSADPNTLMEFLAPVCATSVTLENSWFRLFDLDYDHGIVAFFEPESIDWGTQEVIGPATVEINAYCLDDGLPFLVPFLLPVGSTGPIQLTDEVLTFHNDAITGYCDAHLQSLVIEIHAESCELTGCEMFTPGMNDLGQSGPTYHEAEDCGIVNPADAASLGFPNSHLVLVVNGSGGCPPDDDGGDDGGDDPDVPATNVVSLAALLLAMLGTGVYFARRRTTD